MRGSKGWVIAIAAAALLAVGGLVIGLKVTGVGGRSSSTPSAGVGNLAIPPIQVLIYPESGGIFNSAASQPEHKDALMAWGQKPGDPLWVTSGNLEARFSYKSDPNILARFPQALSGGFLTFYDQPADRNMYGKFSFSCKITDAAKGSNPDFGIRLALDHPEETGEREKVTYELPSISDYFLGKRRIDSNWQEFSIALDDFTKQPLVAPVPPGLNANAVNKVVFYISQKSVQDCPQGTFWFREMTFVPR